jgi:hypothetical protein
MFQPFGQSPLATGDGLLQSMGMPGGTKGQLPFSIPGMQSFGGFNPNQFIANTNQLNRPPHFTAPGRGFQSGVKREPGQPGGRGRGPGFKMPAPAMRLPTKANLGNSQIVPLAH